MLIERLLTTCKIRETKHLNIKGLLNDHVSNHSTTVRGFGSKSKIINLLPLLTNKFFFKLPGSTATNFQK